MKIIPAIIIVILGILVGNSRAAAIDERRQVIEALLSDIRKISMQIEFTSEPIGIILDKIKSGSEQKHLWQRLIEHMEGSQGCKAAWERVLEENTELQSVLQDEEKQSLNTFFAALGTGDKKAEKDNAEYVYKLLDSINTRIKSEAANRIKLCKNLGLLFGIALAILII